MFLLQAPCVMENWVKKKAKKTKTKEAGCKVKYASTRVYMQEILHPFTLSLQNEIRNPSKEIKKERIEIKNC